MSVKFHDLKEITFGSAGAKEVPADLLLKTGSRVQLKVNKSAVFNGDPGTGAFRIQAGNVGKIVFH